MSEATRQNHCFISSHVVISGFCNIGDYSFLGVNSTVIDSIEVGKNCFVGAGALVQKDIAANSVIQGISTKLSKVSSLRLFKVTESD